ncbi:uncharacterized protein LOC111693952 isoform X2 [Trichogramma pretiosum]|uniref:uncharacterized protein LOC111693952 isoform X2 n=1 Tax=Trichogramma pretiosum TaxID=7493 RepID=UPI000C719589|nr:uncharacterized protein LOC111693952 isoform X2 [Trichogramma pretiosum]
MYDHNNQVKPVLVISVDGGSEENPRYHKTIAYTTKHFKEFALNAVFIMTYAPGRLAFNRVERRMAPLSKALSGVILTYNFYGDHINSRRETEDSELEINNFEYL